MGMLAANFDPFYETDLDAVAPGTGDDDPDAPPLDPSAETENTDDGPGGPPESIPYSRFKEVNDQLRPFKEMAEWGYDADSMRQLAEWDAAMARDPVGTWFRVAERIDDLPDELKEAIARHRNGDEGAPPAVPKPSSRAAADDEEEDDEPPEWAQTLLRDREERLAMDEQRQLASLLDETVDLWKAKDKEEGLTDKQATSEKTMLSYIAANAGAGTTADALMEAARADAMEYRAAVLGSAVEGRPSAPSRVPGGAAPGGEAPAPPKTLADAAEATRSFFTSGEGGGT